MGDSGPPPTSIWTQSGRCRVPRARVFIRRGDSFCPLLNRIIVYIRANTVHTRLFPVMARGSNTFLDRPQTVTIQKPISSGDFMWPYWTAKTRRFGPVPWISFTNPGENTIFSVKRDTSTPTICLFIYFFFTLFYPSFVCRLLRSPIETHRYLIRSGTLNVIQAVSHFTSWAW